MSSNPISVSVTDSSSYSAPPPAETAEAVPPAEDLLPIKPVMKKIGKHPLLGNILFPFILPVSYILKLCFSVCYAGNMVLTRLSL